MKTRIYFFGVVLAALALTFTACRKNNLTDYTSDFTTASDDNARLTNASDNLENDENTVMDATPELSVRNNPLCNATITLDTVSNPRVCTITYNGGLNCNGNLKMEGVMMLKIAQGVHWKDAGAVLTVTFQNLKITRVSDNKSIILNGDKVHTNVSGGLVKDLATLGTITRTITSNDLSITFDDGTTRTWSLAKQRVFTYDNGVVVSTTGTGTEGGFSNISEWGTTRNGQEFYGQIMSAMTVRQDCNWRITAGQKVFHKMQRDLTVTFGLDANGAATSCPGTGTYYLKADWTDAHGTAHSVIRPY